MSPPEIGTGILSTKPSLTDGSLKIFAFSIDVKMEDLFWLLFSCSGVSVSSKRISYNTNNSLSVPNRRPEHIYPAHAISGSRQLAPAPRLIGSNNPGKKSAGHLATQPATRKYISVVKNIFLNCPGPVSRVHTQTYCYDFHISLRLKRIGIVSPMLK